MRPNLPAGITICLALLAPAADAAASTVRDGATEASQKRLAAAKNEQSKIIEGFIVDSGPPRPADPKGRYFVEFRARPLSVYGHTYIIYGRLDEAGAPAERRFVALHPQGDVAGLTTGSLPILVPATTLPVSGDRELPVLSSYRRRLNAEQYGKVQAFVYEMRSRPLSWNLYTRNCNHFAGELAKRIGLKTPSQNVQFTPLYVKELEALNQN